MEKFSVSGSENGNIRPRSLASKNPAVSALQDLLFYLLTGIGFYAKNSFDFQKTNKNTNSKITRLLHLTNKGINFGIETMMSAIKEAYNLKNREENLYKFLCKSLNKKPKRPPLSALITPMETLSQMVSQANIINAQKSIKISNLDVFAMKEIIRMSLCASANYLEHSKEYARIPKTVYLLFYDILDFLGKKEENLKECSDYAILAGELHTLVLEFTLKTYEKEFGMIESKKVSSNYKKGNAILVVGEDFDFLKKLLEETTGKEINIYTYGALNYAHAFPEINKYKNLAGIYAGKYGDFASNIEDFPGAVVLTSGNMEELTDIYRGRVFSTEDISMLGVSKIYKDDIKPLLSSAYDAAGFIEDKENPSAVVGFGLKEVEETVNKLYLALKEKRIENIMVFLGCNYYVDEKNYLKKLIKMLPQNIAFITMDCLFLKVKSNKEGLPMVFNLGQYLNFYTLVRLLFALSGKFKKNINEIPLNITIKLKDPTSLASLFMLLSLGIKNIKLNSDLPNYLTEALLNCFSNSFGLSKVIDAKTDAQNINSKRA